MERISYDIAERMTTEQLLQAREQLSEIMERGADDSRPVLEKLYDLSSMTAVCDTLVDRLTSVIEGIIK